MKRSIRSAAVVVCSAMGPLGGAQIAYAEPGSIASLWSAFNMTALGPSITGCLRRLDAATTGVLDSASRGPERK